MDFKTYTGNRIREFRESRNLTQEKMADKLHLVLNQYGRIERGESSCTLSNLIQICNILQITPNDILAELIITKDSSIETEIHKLNESDQKEVMNYIEFLIEKERKNK